MSRTLSMIIAAGCIVLAPALSTQADPAPKFKRAQVAQSTNEAVVVDYSHLPADAQRMLRAFFASRQAQAQPTRGTVTQSPPRPSVTRFQNSTTARADLNFEGLPAEARTMLQDFFASERRPGRVEARIQTSRRGWAPAATQTPARPLLAQRTHHFSNEGSAPQRPAVSTQANATPSARPSANFTSPTSRPTIATSTTITSRTIRTAGTTTPGTRSMTRAATTGATTAWSRTNFSRTESFSNVLSWAQDPFLRGEVIRAIGRNLQQAQQERQGNRRTTGVHMPAS